MDDAPKRAAGVAGCSLHADGRTWLHTLVGQQVGRHTFVANNFHCHAPTCLAKLGGTTYDAVVDNWSKEPELIAPYAVQAKAWGVEHYAFVSSAGMYTPDKGDFSAIDEACAVKSSGQRKAEEKRRAYAATVATAQLGSSGVPSHSVPSHYAH